MGLERQVNSVSDLDALLRLGARVDAQPEVLKRLVGRWLYVRDRNGGRRRLKANAVQSAFEERRAKQNIVLKARQMGMTTWMAGRFLLRTMTHRGMLSVLVAQDGAAAETSFMIVRRMWENLPRALRDGALRLKKSNSQQMVFAELDSEFRVVSAGDVSAGRGLSIQNLHCSEVAHWPGDPAETLAGLRAALAPEGELVLESTPNGAYGAFYEEWMRGVDSAEENGLVRHFFPWWMEAAYRAEAVGGGAMTAEEQSLVERHGLDAAQIGFRRTLERGFGAMREQEFAEDALSCFRATGDCYFDTAAVERRLEEVRGLPATSQRNGALRVWLPPRVGRQYIVAVDTAGGGADGDFAAVQVVDAASGAQCAELQERVDPLGLAQVAAALAREYGGALTVVERNNHGSAVLAYLETVERYEHVYRQGSAAGWLTTAASKPEMLSAMAALVVERPECFVSERLLAECRTFVRERAGRCGAAPGAHDDLVMSMAMAHAVRAETMRGNVRGAV